MSFGPYCYSNNGFSSRAVASSYSPQAGEVIFADVPTSQQLTAAFSGYAAQAAAQAAVAAGNAALAAGLTVNSTSTPALDGVFAVDEQSQSDINAVSTYIVVNGTFPQGQATTYWADKSGSIHLFPSVSVFQAFATAVANYVDAIEDYQNSGGTAGSLPATMVTII